MTGLFTMMNWPESLDWASKSVVILLAMRSVKNGTWPILARGDCSVASLAGESGMTVERVRRGFVAAVESGALKVSQDRSAVAIMTKGVSVAEIGSASEKAGSAKGSGSGGKKKKKSEKRSGRPSGPSLEEAAIFSAWRSGMGKNAATKLSERRLLALRKAMRPESDGGLGFTPEDILRSVQGWVEYCREDPWRLERSSRHELCLLVRDVEHIEQGIEAFDRIETRESESAVAAREAMRREEELRG